MYNVAVEMSLDARLCILKYIRQAFESGVFIDNMRNNKLSRKKVRQTRIDNATSNSISIQELTGGS